MGVAPGVPATGRIFIAWVFRDREWFRAATRHTLMFSCLEEALDRDLSWEEVEEEDEDEDDDDEEEEEEQDEAEEDEEEGEGEDTATGRNSGARGAQKVGAARVSGERKRKRSRRGRLCIYGEVLEEIIPPIPDKVIGESLLYIIFPLPP